jgi:hypothetical protein
MVTFWSNKSKTIPILSPLAPDGYILLHLVNQIPRMMFTRPGGDLVAPEPANNTRRP